LLSASPPVIWRCQPRKERLHCVEHCSVHDARGGRRRARRADTPSRRRSAPPATWSVTDCQGCHEKALGPGFAHTKHAGLELSCAQCHKNVGSTPRPRWPATTGPGAVRLKASRRSRVNSDLPDLPREEQPVELTSAACTRAATWPGTSCHSVARCESRRKAAEDEGRRGHVLHVPPGDARQVAAHVAPPGSRRQGWAARAATIRTRCHAEDGEGRLDQRTLLHLPLGEARAIRLRARPGPRRLRLVPRAARHEPPALLMQKLPNLCYNCHFTALATSGRATTIPPRRASRLRRPGPVRYPTVNSRFIERSCRTCHVQGPRLQPPLRRILREAKP